MLLADGEVDGVRVLKPETVRLARSNLLPTGVTVEGGGFGAGMRVAAEADAPRRGGRVELARRGGDHLARGSGPAAHLII